MEKPIIPQSSKPNRKKLTIKKAQLPPAYTPAARFKCDDKGVWHIGINQQGDQITEADPIRLSDSIYILGKSLDAENNYHIIIQYRNDITKQNQITAIPKSEIGTLAGWQRLQAKGISIMAGRKKRELLADYLQTQTAPTVYRLTNKSGWHSNDYILPSGEILSDGQSNNAPIIYNGDTSQAAAYTESGTLEQWQQHVAQYAAGNSRLLLALGTSLAAPLLAITGEPNGGFHIYGDSSDGKTTAALVGLSVWGKPEALKMQWRGTDLGFSNIALARNDGFLVLDEVAEANPKVITKTAYSIINGKSKVQAAKDGGNRAANEWRILLFSTGELTLQRYVEQSGQKWEAGQSVRMPSLPAATVYGIYEHLHGFKSGAALSDHLQEAAAQYHGTAARAWIKQLQHTPAETIKAAAAAFMATLPELSGQALRVARRFALVAAALELATPITGLPAGVGIAGIKQCFDDWLEQVGAGNYEDRRIMEQATDFMQRNADTVRFSHWSDPYTNSNHAGYKRQTESIDEYWIIPPVFIAEICQGYEPRKVCQVLHAAEWLIKPNAPRWKQQKTGGGWFYVLGGKQPPETNTSE